MRLDWLLLAADGYAAVVVAGGGCEHRPIRPPRADAAAAGPLAPGPDQ